jgi:hypothetical protein
MRFPILIVLTLVGVILSTTAWAGVTFGVNPAGVANLLMGNNNENPPPPGSVGNNSNLSSSNGVSLVPTGHKRVIINEMNVLKLEGTVMVQHADLTPPTALQTGSVVEKGDIVTVYGDSWVILKTHRGDRIGLSGSTVITIDECYMEGPDRQIRLLVQKGTLLFHTNGDDSRQSFFEINMGNVVASINQLQAVFIYDPAKNFIDIKYIEGDIHVIDQTHEETFSIKQSQYNGYTKTNEDNNSSLPEEHTEHTWKNGKMVEQEPTQLDDLDEINFRRFFDGEKPLVPEDSNILMDDSQHVPYRQR